MAMRPGHRDAIDVAPAGQLIGTVIEVALRAKFGEVTARLLGLAVASHHGSLSDPK